MRKEVIEFNVSQRPSKALKIRTGDIVKIHRKIVEGGKERIQVFEGLVIAVKGKQSSSPMMTVRRVSLGVGVELTLPVFSPQIAKIEVIKHAKIRRAKVYYVRNKSVKSLRMKYSEIKKYADSEEVQEKENSVFEENQVRMASK